MNKRALELKIALRKCATITACDIVACTPPDPGRKLSSQYEQSIVRTIDQMGLWSVVFNRARAYKHGWYRIKRLRAIARSLKSRKE